MLLTKLPSLLYILNKTKLEFFYSLVLALLISFLSYKFYANIPKYTNFHSNIFRNSHFHPFVV